MKEKMIRTIKRWCSYTSADLTETNSKKEANNNNNLYIGIKYNTNV